MKLSQEHNGKFDDMVYLPYALWLRGKGRFDEALGAFLKAERRDLSRAMTEQLMCVQRLLVLFCHSLACRLIVRTKYADFVIETARTEP